MPYKMQRITGQNQILFIKTDEHEDKKGKIVETWGIPKRSVIQFVAESGVRKINTYIINE